MKNFLEDFIDKFIYSSRNGIIGSDLHATNLIDPLERVMYTAEKFIVTCMRKRVNSALFRINFWQ